MKAFTNPMSASRPSGLLGAALIAPALWLAGCAVEVQNRQPAQALAQEAGPPGSVYTGWRVFQDKCAGCHGPAANGNANVPDLVASVRTMGPRRFVDVVLRRYDWNMPPPAAGDNAAREAMIEEIVQRKAGMLTMPAWQGEPRVNAHIVDLYAYLAARADGTLGTGRPAR